MIVSSGRIRREKKTVEAMIQIFYHDFHQTKKELCNHCKELMDYPQSRLEKCPFQDRKTTCTNCRIH
jgi:hypothetical protein